ncbi:hypothetical protein [Piscinibacter gummiphilus]|uniref:OmpA-like domain-containing protein n=1 Tax=Piscinibacter gummiphilus TaxID=946333 RepID=A0ABZ0D1V7_9BURK|nr:hypothetical protein [Piscinibacter gummiphilus]WOB11178.1 hypothetical protein RXV79_27485 [Piscinibacter gummiphilus]
MVRIMMPGTNLAAAVSRSSWRGAKLLGIAVTSVTVALHLQLDVSAAPSPSAVEALTGRSLCTRDAVELAKTPGTLRRVADSCRDFPDLAILAVSKLNGLPPPKPLSALNKGQLKAGAFGESHSADIAIFFGVGESYPTDEGLHALRTFIDQLNAGGGVVKSVFVLGSADAAEADTQLGRPLATRRAAVLHDYLVAAGVEKQAITVAIATGRGTEGRPSPADRMAKAVVVLQKQAAQ